MGYSDVFNVFENEDWETRCRREGGELLVEQGNLVCPHCLLPFMRARLISETVVICPTCGKEIKLSP